jgi:hypothetical protein
MGARESRIVDRQPEDEFRDVIEASMAEAPLPIGWEEALNNKNQTYYINYLDQFTTFQDPRVAQKKKRLRKKENYLNIRMIYILDVRILLLDYIELNLMKVLLLKLELIEKLFFMIL